MPVATVPSYSEMWVDPRVVAALSDGLFTYTAVDPWAPNRDYARHATVLHGDAPYGGYIWTATAAIPAGAAPPGVEPAWALEQQATADRLRLFTATTQATWLLDTHTRYTLHGIECWAEDYQVHTCTIRLRRTPVTHVNSVTQISRCNVASDFEVPNWCHKSAQTISVCCNGCGWTDFSCGCDNNVVRVNYTIGSNLPPGTEALCAWLAIEYGKAAQGSACALPERISNVTRQGVSWTLLDPQDFLDKGYTGMSRVDHWLATVNPTIGGQMIDPLTSNRLFSRQVDCPVPTLLP